MSEFEEREQAFERKFELDEELEFKIASRGAHLFGLWAAEQLGLKGADAETYAQKAIDTEMSKSGRADLVTKTELDFKVKGISFSRHRIEMEMDACLLKAQEQILGVAKSA